MRAWIKLNVRQVASLSEPGVYSDGGGLHVRVRPAGTKSWIFVRVVNKKRRELGLGSTREVTLAEARERAAELRQAFREGRDPAAERRAEKVASAPEANFGKFAEAYIKRIVSGFKNPKHQAQWRSTIETYAAALYPLALSSIETRHILAVVEPIWLTKPETAGRVRQRLERIFDAARVEGLRDGDNPARLKGHLNVLLPRQSKSGRHHKALPFAKLPALMRALEGRTGNAAIALRFAILTAARTGEILGAKWREFDLDARVWTVPAERMKANEEHQVPLSDAAMAILTSIKPKKAHPDSLVFHNGKGSSLSNMAMTQVLKRMGETDVTVHGFRSTFRDWAGEQTTYPRDAAEMALAHQVGGKTERAYRRGRSLEKRREMMADWAEFAESGK